MPYNYDSIEQQLRLAAKAGNTALVESLLEQGAQIDAAPSPRTTAFGLALRYRHFDTARLLLQRGASTCLANARTLEELRFLQACGVKDDPLEHIDARNIQDLEAYCRSIATAEEAVITLSLHPDPMLIAPTTIAEAEQERSSLQQDLTWEILKARMQPGDELWKFDNGMWDQFAGRMGYVLIRQGSKIMHITTLRN
jgi:ankyrin repeat protein